MSEAAKLGLAGLLAAMAPPAPAPPAPEIDLEILHDDAWKQGFEAGSLHAEAELAPLRLALAHATAAFTTACTIAADPLRPVLMQMVRQIAEAVVMAELRIDPSVLLRLIDAALAMLRPAETAALRVHPFMVDRLRDYLPAIAIQADPAVAEDAFVVAGADFVIESGLAARLADIMAEIA
jgi:flagellar biosynthesis/type III secretory pathway protein FliH